MNQFSPRRRRVIQGGFAAASVLAWSPTIQAQSNYPNRPIKILVPFPPGNTIDIMVRLLQNHMSASLGQSIVVENIGGAGGRIGTAAIVRANPDGYTIGLMTSSLLMLSVSVVSVMSQARALSSPLPWPRSGMRSARPCRGAALILWRELNAIENPVVREDVQRRVREAMVRRLGVHGEGRLRERLKVLASSLSTRGFDVEQKQAGFAIGIHGRNNYTIGTGTIGNGIFFAVQ